MDAKTIFQADYLDIIYHNRNKLYGAYMLRKTQDRRSIQAMLVILSFVLAFCIWTFIDSRNAGVVTAAVKHTDSVVYELRDIKPPIEQPKLPPEQPKEMAAAKPTIKNPLPVIKPDETVTAVMPPVDSFAGRESGAATHTGDPNGTTADVKKSGGNGTGVVPALPQEPAIYVEEMPEFMGDLHTYLAKMVKYPRAAVQNGVQGRVLVNFVVNENGGISNVIIKRGIGSGCDEEAVRVVSGMPRWKPGRQNGRNVRVYFTLPINFRLR